MKKFFKTILTAITGIGLTLGFAVAPAGAESTTSALVRYAAPLVERTVDPTTREVQFLAGEFVQISAYFTLKNSSLSPNITAGDKLRIESGVEIKSGSPLTNAYGFQSINGSSGNGYFDNQSSGLSAEFTLANVPTYLSASVTYSGTAATNVTIKFNPTLVVDGYTFVADDFQDVRLDANTGRFQSGYQQNRPVLGHAIDTSIIFSTETACVNTSTLTQGETLVASFSVNDGTSQVGTPYYEWSVRGADGMMGGMPGMNSSFTVPSIPAGSNLVFEGRVEVSSVVDAKTYTFTDYKVVKQGSTTNLLTHCKETLATGVLSVSGTTVTGTLTTSPDSSGGGMPGMGGFMSYGCSLYTVADTNFANPLNSASANAYGQSGPSSNPTCNLRSVPAGTYKMGIRGFSFSGIGSEKILPGTITVGGTPSVTPAKKTPKAAVVASRLKIGRTITVALHATKGTASKGVNADGLGAVVSVTSASKKYCSATKIVKNKKITGYTIKGLKAGKCSVVVTVTGSSTFNALTKTTAVTVSK